MAQTVADRTGVRFGVFEADFASGELRKRGIKIPIQTQPLEILRLLVERPGQVVTRGELRERLWPADTFVDFEHSLNSAVQKLRRALGDSSDNPRFVETLSRRGYRFIAPVQELAADGVEERRSSPASPVWTATAPGVSPSRIKSWAFAGLIVPCLLALYWLFPAPAPRIARLARITQSVAVDPWGEIVTDGARLYFLERERDHWNLVQTSTSGGPVGRFPAPFQNTKIQDVSPDLSEFLVASFVQREPELPLWIMPAQGGAPKRLGDVVASVARWTPSGRQILYGKGQDLFVVNNDGSGSRKFLTLPGVPGSLSWSPNGSVLRYSVCSAQRGCRLWEVSSDGRGAHPLFSVPDDLRGDLEGRFSQDGKFFLFTSWRGGRAAIWAVREGAGFPRRIRREPVSVTSGPEMFWDPVPARMGARFFVFGLRSSLDELSCYEIGAKRLVQYMPDIHAEGAVYSRDGKWIAFTVAPEESIWRSRADGSERRQLTFPGLHAHRPSWSPDDSRIAFQAEASGGAPRIYLVSANGGRPQPLPGQDVQAFPDWSPDGASIAFSRMGTSDSESEILLFDVRDSRVSKIPGSGRKICPRWSPDQRFVAALSEDQKRLFLYDVNARTWAEAASGVLLTGPYWSGSFLYFQDLLEPDQPVYRLRLADRSRERVADFRESLTGGVSRIGFAGLRPDGDLLLLLSRGHDDIYSLDLE